jgi:hypothetical protein
VPLPPRPACSMAALPSCNTAGCHTTAFLSDAQGVQHSMNLAAVHGFTCHTHCKDYSRHHRHVIPPAEPPTRDSIAILQHVLETHLA